MPGSALRDADHLPAQSPLLTFAGRRNAERQTDEHWDIYGGNDMRRATWILGVMAAASLAACGPKEQNNAGGAETGAGTGMSDTTSMAPSAAPMDTAMTHDTGAARDTTAPK